MRLFISVLILFVFACEQQPQNIALGTLERDRIALTATANEIVVALPVAEGSDVTVGMVLVQLDNRLQKAQVDKASAEVLQAQANLEKLRKGARKEDLAAAKAMVAEAKARQIESEANYQRTIKTNRDVISQVNLDKALAARDASLAALQNAKEQYRKLLNGTRIEDLKAAEAHLGITMANLSSQQKKLSDLTITATRNGILDNLPWNLGERVTIGSPVAIVLAGKAPYARIYVPEPYRIKVNVGDELVVHVDGLEKSLKGRVRWISTEPAFTPYYALNQEERSRLMYLAKIQLAESEAHLPNGVPAQVELP